MFFCLSAAFLGSSPRASRSKSFSYRRASRLKNIAFFHLKLVNSYRAGAAALPHVEEIAAEALFPLEVGRSARLRRHGRHGRGREQRAAFVVCLDHTRGKVKHYTQGKGIVADRADKHLAVSEIEATAVDRAEVEIARYYACRAADGVLADEPKLKARDRFLAVFADCDRICRLRADGYGQYRDALR